MTKLFVGGIPYSCTNQQLEELFSKFGKVSSAQIIMDKYSNQSKGFAFIEMSSDEAAKQAVKELDGYGLDGRRIGVSVAKPREENRNSFSTQGRDNSRFNKNKRY